MNFEDKLNNLLDNLEQKLAHIATEEATKTSIVMPFINALGYDIFNPKIVIPEFTADIGKKKGEKVDYAIMQNEEPLILIEVKNIYEDLDKHSTQLERYFGVTSAKFGILTNGLEYRFYSDLENINVMDKMPFMIIDLQSIKDRDIKELEQFTADKLNVDSLTEIAHKRRYITSIKNYIEKQFKKPDEDFLKLIGKECGIARMTDKKIEEFLNYTQIALNEVLNDTANRRLGIMKDNITQLEGESDEEIEDDIITTEEELNGFFIIKAILAETVDDIATITPKDTKSYFGILINNNAWKWVCRLHFNTKQKYLGYRTDDKKEIKIALQRIEDLYRYKKEIVSAYNKACSE